jgi:hypothetical protein
MMCGILKIVFLKILINMDTESYMMLVVLLVLEYLLLFVMELGTGLVPDLIIWCKYRVGYLPNNAGLFGSLLLGFILVLKHGSRLNPDLQR